MEQTSQTQKPKKKFYKRWWFWVIVIIVLYVIGSASLEEAKKKAREQQLAIPEQIPSSQEQIPKEQPAGQKVPEPEPILLSGVGQQASQKFTLEKGLAIFRMTHSGQHNFAIELLNDSGQHIDLLVNEIGSFDGARAVGIESKGIYLLDISADGQWSVRIEQPRPSVAQSIPQTFTGKGQQVSEMFRLNKGLAIFKMTHDGSHNFAITLLDRNGKYIELLVNEIGNFDGSKAVRIEKDEIYLLDITADGNWSIAIE